HRGERDPARMRARRVGRTPDAAGLEKSPPHAAHRAHFFYIADGSLRDAVGAGARRSRQRLTRRSERRATRARRQDRTRSRTREIREGEWLIRTRAIFGCSWPRAA